METVWPIDASAYNLLERIGFGGCSVVHKACTVNNKDTVVAIKIVRIDNTDINLEAQQREVRAMLMLRHDNLVTMHTSFLNGQELWIVLPWMQLGSCARWLRTKHTGFHDDEVLLATLLLSIVRCVEYLHHSGYVHRDIKAGNVLLSANGEVLLADLGVCRDMLDHGVNRKRKVSTLTGSPCWMAPEVIAPDQLSGNGYDERADIWSVGITALELAFGHAPYANCTSPMKIIMHILKDEPPSVHSYDSELSGQSHAVSSAFASFVNVCLQKNPDKRASASKLMKHRFLTRAKGPECVRDYFARIQLKQSPLAQPLMIDKEKYIEIEPFSFSLSDKRPLMLTIHDEEEEEEVSVDVTTQP